MTSFQLPTYTAPAAGWQLSDYKPKVILSGTADSTGALTVNGPTVDPGFRWLIERAIVSTSSGTKTPSVRLYDSAVGQQGLVSGSNTAAYDEAEYPRGLLLDQAAQLIAVFVGAAAGDFCVLRLQVAVLSQVAA